MTNEQTDTAMPATGTMLPDENNNAIGPLDKEGIEDKVGFGIAVMNTRLKTEPYLRNGILYTCQNDSHVIAYYQIPPDATHNEIISPLFLSVGPDIDDCLRETRMSLLQQGVERAKWEIFPIDTADLERITQIFGKDRYTQGLSLSIHRTPVTYIAEHYQPEPESKYRKLRLEVLKRNMLKRHGIDPDKPGE